MVSFEVLNKVTRRAFSETAGRELDGKLLSGIGGQPANRIRHRQVIGSSPIVGSIITPLIGLVYESGRCIRIRF
jgi:hypothetical protein